MKMETLALIKGVEEKEYKGKMYRNVLFFGTEGKPCDIRAACNEDMALFEKAKKFLYQKGRVLLEFQQFEGRPAFNLVNFEPVNPK